MSSSLHIRLQTIFCQSGGGHRADAGNAASLRQRKIHGHEVTHGAAAGEGDDILNINHNGKIIARMSVNPEEIINKVEFGTSRLRGRIEAINKYVYKGPNVQHFTGFTSSE